MLDRWSVSVVTTGKGGFRKSQKDRSLIMNNYLGIGVDGQVALDFHKVGGRKRGKSLFWTGTVLYSMIACTACCAFRSHAGHFFVCVFSLIV